MSPTPATRLIFIIRHGEKPSTTPPPPTTGIDLYGNVNSHSLVPQGWQRAGALATLFAPYGGQLRAELVTPIQLYAPSYSDPTVHRTYETILPLSLLTNVAIQTPYAEGSEQQLGQEVAGITSGVTLICWEHTAIAAIANAILGNDTTAPQDWPDDRFDVIFSFALDAASNTYAFSQIPQMLLSGDSATPIS